MARCRFGNRGAGQMGDDPPIFLCKLASMVEHIVHIDGVTGSSPVATTTIPGRKAWDVFLAPDYIL